MSFISNAVGSVIGGITGSKQATKAAVQAANVQAASADKAIAEQRSAREEYRDLSQPYTDAGSKAIAAQMALIGLNGTAGQQDAINALTNGPEYTTAVRQGEEAILQNAAATGGLRGGNVQNSLSKFRADLVSNLINKQYQNLGGLTTIGQNAAAQTGSAGFTAAGNIGDLLAQQARAQGVGIQAKGNSVANNFNSTLQLASAIAGF